MFLKLNGEKTVIKFLRSKRQQINLPIATFLDIVPTDPIKSLGVFINGKLKFDDLVASKVKICNLHLRNLYSIRPSLNQATRVLLVTNLILSKIDYCNIILLGSTAKTLYPLKIIFNKASGVFTHFKSVESFKNAAPPLFPKMPPLLIKISTFLYIKHKQYKSKTLHL